MAVAVAAILAFGACGGNGKGHGLAPPDGPPSPAQLEQQLAEELVRLGVDAAKSPQRAPPG